MDLEEIFALRARMLPRFHGSARIRGARSGREGASTMRIPARSTGLGGGLSLKSGRAGRRAITGPAIDELYPEGVHHPGAAWATGGDAGVCPRCLALFEAKRWIHDPARALKRLSEPASARKVCPTCHRIGTFAGELRIWWPGIEARKPQVLATLERELMRSRAVNPLARLVHLEERPSVSVLYLSQASLAHRLARVLERAFRGSRVVRSRGSAQREACLAWGFLEGR